VPQQTGVLFIIRQQVQPDLSMVVRQSQHAWTISAHLLSPLVQVTHTPSLVISHLHIAMVKLQQQTVMPFIMTQQLHIPPASIVHRFCTMLQAILSSHEQVIFIPPVHFSTLKVQRGTISQFVPVGIPVGVPIGVPMPGTLIPGMPMPVRSVIIVLSILRTPFCDWKYPSHLTDEKLREALRRGFLPDGEAILLPETIRPRPEPTCESGQIQGLVKTLPFRASKVNPSFRKKAVRSVEKTCRKCTEAFGLPRSD
jgi:hypothetical protein